MPAAIQKIRVFVSSPSDVTSERKQLKEVIEEINHTNGQHMGFMLEFVEWETHTHPGMGRPQSLINEQIGAYDIFIGIMCRRFGSPTGKAGSGTEEEFRIAYDSWKATRKPLILFYFCDASAGGMPRSRHDLQQLAQVMTFREELFSLGLVREYPSRSKFASVVRRHLLLTLFEMFPPRPATPTEPVTISPKQISLSTGNQRTYSLVKVHNRTDDVLYQVWAKLVVEPSGIDVNLSVEPLKEQLDRNVHRVEIEDADIRIGNLMGLTGRDTAGRYVHFFRLSTLDPRETWTLELRDRTHYPGSMSSEPHILLSICDHSDEPASVRELPGEGISVAFEIPESCK
jgi:hypothetical protein